MDAGWGEYKGEFIFETDENSIATKHITEEEMYATVIFNQSGLLSSDVYNYPNPFNNYRNENTTIRYMLKNQASEGEFFIIDASGKVIFSKKLNSSELEPGTHKFVWKGVNDLGQKLSSGIYFGFIKLNNDISKRLKIVIHNK